MKRTKEQSRRIKKLKKTAEAVEELGRRAGDGTPWTREELGRKILQEENARKLRDACAVEG